MSDGLREGPAAAGRTRWAQPPGRSAATGRRAARDDRRRRPRWHDRRAPPRATGVQGEALRAEVDARRELRLAHDLERSDARHLPAHVRELVAQLLATRGGHRGEPRRTVRELPERQAARAERVPSLHRDADRLRPERGSREPAVRAPSGGRHDRLRLREHRPPRRAHDADGAPGRHEHARLPQRAPVHDHGRDRGVRNLHLARVGDPELSGVRPGLQHLPRLLLRGRRARVFSRARTRGKGGRRAARGAHAPGGGRNRVRGRGDAGDPQRGARERGCAQAHDVRPPPIPLGGSRRAVDRAGGRARARAARADARPARAQRPRGTPDHRRRRKPCAALAPAHAGDAHPAPVPRPRARGPSPRAGGSAGFRSQSRVHRDIPHVG